MHHRQPIWSVRPSDGSKSDISIELSNVIIRRCSGVEFLGSSGFFFSFRGFWSRGKNAIFLWGGENVKDSQDNLQESIHTRISYMEL